MLTEALSIHATFHAQSSMHIPPFKYLRYTAFPNKTIAVKGKEDLAQNTLNMFPVRLLQEILDSALGDAPHPNWIMESITDNIEALGGLQVNVCQWTPPAAQTVTIQPVSHGRSSSRQRGSSTGKLRADFALMYEGQAGLEASDGPSFFGSLGADASMAAGPGGALSSGAACPVGATSSRTGGPGGGSRQKAFRSWLKAAMRFILVAEIKRFTKLDRNGCPVGLAAEYSKQPPDALSRSVRAMLDQLWTYMVVTGVEFSWFSCYYYTWIAWRSPDDPTRLQLSQPFSHYILPLTHHLN